MRQSHQWDLEGQEDLRARIAIQANGAGGSEIALRTAREQREGIEGCRRWRRVARIGAGAAFATASLRITTVVPETVTPPFAVPFSTGRVS